MKSPNGRAALALLAVLAVAGCGNETATREDGRATPGRGETPAAVTPAQYVTDLTYVPFAPGARGLHYRFLHRTSADLLHRRYAGWSLGPGGWSPRLSLRDSLPVPRAGWRLLPTGDLRIVVDGDGELRALADRRRPGTTDDGPRPLRLEADRTLSEWSSPTGQRERMRLAFLDSAGRRLPGVLLERRSARPLDAPPARGMYGFWLVSDSAGNGLAVLRQGGTPTGRMPPPVDSTGTAHGWISGEGRSWRGVRIERLAPPDTTGGRITPPAEGWELRVPEANLRGRLRPGPLVRTGSAPGTRIYALSGTLTVRGRTRQVGGIAVESGTP